MGLNRPAAWFAGLFAVVSVLLCFLSPVSPTVTRGQSICDWFQRYPHWRTATKAVEQRWHIPVALQMAIVWQESRFHAHARPYRLTWAGRRPASSARGYAQALNGTWRQYLKETGQIAADRTSFKASVDFIGWYLAGAKRALSLNNSQVAALYLAYHEGIAGYRKGSYHRQPALMRTARQVAAQAVRYHVALRGCRVAERLSRPAYQ
jgi:hypothetical protein